MRHRSGSSQVQAVKTDTYEGTVVTINVDTTGIFRAEVEGQALHADTIKKLEGKIRDHLRSNRAVVPATLMEEDSTTGRLTFEAITITGIHAQNGHTMYRDSEGNAQTSYGGYTSMLLCALTSEEQQALQALYTAHITAEAAYDDVKRAARLNPTKALGLPNADQD